jgi:hypothetical protein
MTMEVWKPVVGFEGLYEVSDQGRVRGVDRFISCLSRWGGVYSRFVVGRILSPARMNHGYNRVVLYGPDGYRRDVTVHSLVAAAFIGPRPLGEYVCHGDGDPGNNGLSNLRYDTPKENERDKIRHGRRGLGEKAPSSKLTEAEVRAIRRLRGVPQQELAEKFGCTFSNISAIQLYKSWGHVAD